MHELLAAAGLFALVTVALYAEVVLHIGTHSFGGSSPDKHIHFWDFWWAWKSLVDLGTPFSYSEYIGYPPGMSLWRGNSGPLLSYFTVPIRLLTGSPIATYNLTVLLSLWMTCLGGYWLVRCVGGTPLGALCAGAVLAFNPLVLFHANLGFLEYLNLAPAALFIGYSLRMIREGGRWSALASLMSFIVASTWCWYMGLLLVVFAALVFVFEWRAVLVRLRSPRTAAPLFLWGVLVAALLLLVGRQVGDPGLAATKAELEREFVQDRKRIESVRVRWARLGAIEVHYEGGETVSAREFPMPWLGLKFAYSLDPSYLLGGPRDSSAGAVSRDRTPSRTLCLLYWLPGLVLAALALIELREGRRGFLVGLRRGRGVYLAAIALFGGLSLGPCLVVAHEVQLGSYDFTPLSVLARIVPTFARVQFPIRFLFGVLFALAVLGGLGFERLLTIRRYGKRAPELACAAFVASVALSQILVSDHTPRHEQIEVPDFYQLAGIDQEPYALIEVPLSCLTRMDGQVGNQIFGYYQTIHGKRRFCSHIPAYLEPYRSPADIEENHLLDLLARLSENEVVDAEEVDDPQLKLSVGVLWRHGFRYVVLHENDATLSPRALWQLHALLQRAFGSYVVDESTAESLVIFSVDEPDS